MSEQLSHVIQVVLNSPFTVAPIDDEDHEAYEDGVYCEDDEEEQEPGICPNCNGSGEGMYEGTTCRMCKGKGET